MSGIYIVNVDIDERCGMIVIAMDGISLLLSSINNKIRPTFCCFFTRCPFGVMTHER